MSAERARDVADELAAWLAGNAEAPASAAELAALPSPELDLLRALCHGRPARARLAARSLAGLVKDLSRTSAEEVGAPAPAADVPAPASPIVDPARVGAWEEGLRDAQGEAQRVMALEDDVARLSPWLGVGWHTGGSTLVDVVHDRLDALATLLARRADLVRIADALGRMEAAERAGRGVERGGRETVVGVTMGGDLSDVLPNELALLADADTEDLFYARLVERQLMCLEMSGELEGRVPSERRPGPVIACVDTSGSMMGPAEELAKAATLAVMRRALGQGRRCSVLLFGGRDSVKQLDFEPGRASAHRLFDLLMASFHGGTHVDGALRHALDKRASDPAFARADVLLVTDGVARVKAATVDAIARARDGGMRLVLALIGQRPVMLGDLADETLHVPLESGAERA
ncbi:MAG: VWA domain-containing protein [Deltaproteobacteria bacterium]|nr:VWA domain-containing protein [Deltaproteobacteria bacterium]